MVSRMDDDACKLDYYQLDYKPQEMPNVSCHYDSGHFCAGCYSGRTNNLQARTERLHPFMVRSHQIICSRLSDRTAKNWV